MTTGVPYRVVGDSPWTGGRGGVGEVGGCTGRRNPGTGHFWVNGAEGPGFHPTPPSTVVEAGRPWEGRGSSTTGQEDGPVETFSVYRRFGAVYDPDS